MLAPNFLPAASLGLTMRQHLALIKVLGMLERGELFELSDDHGTPVMDSFCMKHWSTCICGWANRLYPGAFNDDPKGPGYKLFMRTDFSMSNAAAALRDFLTIGKYRNIRWL